MIVVNKIKCRHCGDIIESITQHDFKRCKCGKVGIDGGKVWLRRIGSPEDVIELSLEIEDDEAMYIRKMIELMEQLDEKHQYYAVRIMEELIKGWTE